MKTDKYPLPRSKDTYVCITQVLAHTLPAVSLVKEDTEYTRPPSTHRKAVSALQQLSYNYPFSVGSTPSLYFTGPWEYRKSSMCVHVYLDASCHKSGYKHVLLGRATSGFQRCVTRLKETSVCPRHATIKSEVEYLGHRISDQDKVKAISNAPPHCNISQLKTVWGWLKYYLRISFLLSLLAPQTVNKTMCHGSIDSQLHQAFNHPKKGL